MSAPTPAATRPMGITVLAVLSAIGGVLGILGGVALVGLGGFAAAATGTAGLFGLAAVFGIVALVAWAWRQPPGRYPRALPRAPVSNAMRLRAVFAIICVSSTLAIAGFIANDDLHLHARVFHFLIGGMTGLALAWCAVAVVFRRHSSTA